MVSLLRSGRMTASNAHTVRSRMLGHDDDVKNDPSLGGTITREAGQYWLFRGTMITSASQHSGLHGAAVLVLASFLAGIGDELRRMLADTDG
jgi:hypothetical protein